MSQPLPSSNFRCLTDEEMKDSDVMVIPIFMYISKKSNVSLLCISEYPHQLHDLHKDYQLAPEHLQIEENILSDYQCHLFKMKDSSNLYPSSSQIFARRRTISSTNAI